MAVKERSQIKGTDAQIKAFAGHNGVLAFATDTKSLHVLSGTAGTTTEFLPSSKVATKTELANYTPTTSLAAVATSGSYNDLSDKPVVDSALSSTSENPVQNKVVNSALDGKLNTSGGTVSGAVTFNGAITANYLKRSAGQKELIIGGTDNDGCLQLYAGDNVAFSSNKTASLFLTSTDYTGASIPAGEFYLTAMDATTGPRSLVGSPNGTLTWSGHNVITVVAESYSANSWYRKYSDGWIEQGGQSGTPDNQSYVVITFPTAFTNSGYTITFCVNMDYHAWLSNKKTTDFTVSRKAEHTGGMGVWWYACGK